MEKIILGFLTVVFCFNIFAQPINFSYNGHSVNNLEAATKTKTIRADADQHTYMREWLSPDSRLLLRTTITEYHKFPVTEYVPELICLGDQPTAIVSDFKSLAMTFASDRVTLRALRGTVNTDNDFETVTPVFGTAEGETNHFEMVASEGRSSAQWMPWWGVDLADGSGLEVGVGWSGAWRGNFALTNGNFHMSAGLVKTHFRLLPGETIRQPSILIFTRKCGVSVQAMQTLIHRFMIEVKSPRDENGELFHSILPITSGGGNKTPKMMMKMIDWKIKNDMPFNCFWVDAGWNGPPHMPDLISNCGNMWYNFVGDWRFNSTIHPDGDLGKVADAAHAAGMRMLLWMEPERCTAEPTTEVYQKHRDWLLPKNDADIEYKSRLILNLGNPAALNWIIETISDHIRRSKLDMFRQDLNVDPLPFWQANDAEDRQGITEIKHIMGLWQLWDELRRRFPHLIIENCAAGGRRIDFEAVSRSHSYCRTDYAIFHRGPSQIVDMQNITLNTLPYLPFQGSETTPARMFDDYGIFSSFCAGAVFTPSDWDRGIVVRDFSSDEIAWLRNVFKTADRMRPFYEGDFYPLTDNRSAIPEEPMERFYRGSREEKRWCAWQMHRPDLDAGFVIAFRRLDTKDSKLQMKLGGINSNALYEVEIWNDKKSQCRGRDLANMTLELREPRSFRLYFYRKLP